MHDIATKTGPYLHAVDDAAIVLFETGGTPRSFTVLIASAREELMMERTRNGVAILDNDRKQVVLDEHARNDRRACVEAFEEVRMMSWEEFSSFCRENPRHRGVSPDIVEKKTVPDPGSRRNQKAMGAARAASKDAGGDLRSDHMIRSHDNPACPYDFPPVTRDDAIREVSRALLHHGEDGLHRLKWMIDVSADIGVEGLSGDFSVDRSRDAAWEQTMHQHPEITEEAILSALAPLLSGSVSTWGAMDEGRYVFRIEAERGDVMTLASLDQTSMAFGGRGHLVRSLEALDSSDLRDLWKLKRTVDHDLEPGRLSARISADVNRIRAEIEAGPSPEENLLEP